MRRRRGSRVGAVEGGWLGNPNVLSESEIRIQSGRMVAARLPEGLAWELRQIFRPMFRRSRMQVCDITLTLRTPGPSIFVLRCVHCADYPALIKLVRL